VAFVRSFLRHDASGAERLREGAQPDMIVGSIAAAKGEGEIDASISLI
jgi:hypothetical protein